MGVWAVPAGNQTGLPLADLWAVPLGNQAGLPFEPTYVPPVVPTPTRYTNKGITTPWQRAPRRGRANRINSKVGVHRAASVAPRWQSAPRAGASFAGPWSLVPRRAGQLVDRWAHGRRITPPSIGLPWNLLDTARQAFSARWGHGARRSAASTLLWLHPDRKNQSVEAGWEKAGRKAQAAGLPWLHPDGKIRRLWWPWKHGRRVEWHVGSPGVGPEPPEVPLGNWHVPPGNQAGVNFACQWSVPAGNHAGLPFGPYACYNAALTQRTYIVLNSAAVVRLPERTPIAVDAIEIGSSADDAYFSLRLGINDPAHLNLLIGLDDPKQVEININGHVWTGIVEDWSKDKAFPGATVGCSGRSLTALLDAPYAPSRGYSNVGAKQAQQLVEDELDLTDYTADYDTVTWLVPDGVFTYADSSPIAAIAQVAAASGAVVQSHPWDKVVRVVPRYPVSPWEWPVTAADKLLVDDYVVRQGYRSSTTGNPVYAVDVPLWPPTTPGKPGRVLPLQLCEFSTSEGTVKGLCLSSNVSATMEAGALVVWQTLEIECVPVVPKVNFVYVSGEQVGVADSVVREGTAGDKRLPQIIDPLITDHIASQERGRNAIAGGSDNRAKANLWARLSNTVGPGGSYIKGVITSVNGDGTVSVATADGAGIRARTLAGQEWEALDPVFVLNGRTVERAPQPDLPGGTILV